jgi:dienelactone hydrolase
MIPEEFSCLAYWQNRYRELEPVLFYKAKTFESYKRWRQKFRRKFIDCLGKMPDERLPLDVSIVEEVETGQFFRRKVVYRADRFSRVPAYLFIPKKKEFPVPGIVCPHGHGRGKEDTSGVADTQEEKDHLKKYNYNYAEQFAVRGYVSLAPDLRCFGERKDDPEKVYGYVKIREGDHWCDVNFILGMLIGYNLLTLHIFDITRGIDLLQSLKEVNRNRIGCAGLSLGGTATLFSSAYEKRIKVAGICGYFNSLKAYPLLTGELCGSEVLPGLLTYGDHVEIAGLIAPRPLFLEFGISDALFPIEASRSSFQRLKGLYETARAGDKLEVEEFEGAHEFKGNKIFDFFKKWL